MTTEARSRFCRTKYIWVAMLAVPVLFGAIGAARAQQVCVPHEAAADQLQGKFDERVVGRGLMKGGKAMVELFASKKGTWTVVITSARGRACLVASGSDWSAQKLQAEEDPT